MLTNYGKSAVAKAQIALLWISKSLTCGLTSKEDDRNSFLFPE